MYLTDDLHFYGSELHLSFIVAVTNIFASVVHPQSGNPHNSLRKSLPLKYLSVLLPLYSHRTEHMDRTLQQKFVSSSYGDGRSDADGGFICRKLVYVDLLTRDVQPRW